MVLGPSRRQNRHRLGPDSSDPFQDHFFLFLISIKSLVIDVSREIIHFQSDTPITCSGLKSCGEGCSGKLRIGSTIPCFQEFIVSPGSRKHLHKVASPENKLCKNLRTWTYQHADQSQNSDNDVFFHESFKSKLKNSFCKNLKNKKMQNQFQT